MDKIKKDFIVIYLARNLLATFAITVFSFVYDNNFKWTIVKCKRTDSYIVQHRIRYYGTQDFYEDISNNFVFKTFQAAQEKFEKLKGELQCQ